MRQSVFLAALALVLLSHIGAANCLFGEEKDDFLVSAWDGQVKDTALLKHAPKNGKVDDKDTFEKLWKAWRDKKEVPTVDFKKHVVSVYSEKGVKHTIGQFLSNEGMFAFVIFVGREQDKPKDIDGFHYQIVVVRRDKVKSFDPKPFVANLNK